MTSKAKSERGVNGGTTLAKIKGYHELLAKRSHGQISKATFKKQAAVLLAKAKKSNGRSTGKKRS